MIRQQPDGTYIDDETGQPADVGQGVMGAQGGNSAAPTIAKNMTPPPAPAPAPEPPAPPAAPQGDGAPQTFALPPVSAAAPARTMETEGTSTTVSGMDRKSRAAIQDAERQQEGVLAKREQNAARAGEVAKGEAQDQAAIAAEQQQIAEQKAAAQQQAIDHGEQVYQRAIKTYDDEYQKWKSMDIQDFYAGDKGKERALWSAMTIALGGLAQGQMARAQILSGGSPTAQNEGVSLVQKNIDTDYQRQKERIAKQFQIAEHSKEGIERARTDQLHALNMLNIQTAAKSDAVASKMASMLAARGVSKADIATNETILGLQQQSAALRAQVAQQTAQHVQTTVQKRLTEQTGGAGANGAGAKAGFEVYGPNGQVVGYAPDKETAAKANAEVQQLIQARRHVADLRKNFDEYGVEYSAYFPGFESDALKQRKQARDALVRAMKNPSGDASDKDLELLQSQVASDKDLRNANSTRLEGISKDIDERINGVLARVGIQPGVVGRVVRGEARPRPVEMPQNQDVAMAYTILRDPRSTPDDRAAAQRVINMTGR